MRVLVVATAYPRSEDDVITPWLVHTLDRLVDRGVHCEVLAPAYRGLGDHTLGSVRVNRFRYAPAAAESLTHDQTAPDRILTRPWYALLVPTYLLAGAAAIRRLVRERGFDVVHAHWPIPHAHMAFAGVRGTDVPVVSSFHGVELTLVRNRLPILRPALRQSIRRSRVVTANSRYTAGMIRDVYDRPVERIPFGAAADVARDARPEPSEAAGRRLLFVGRLVERKGIPVLLEAVASLRDLDVHLDIVGDGPLRPELEARAAALGLSARVAFRGFVTAEELADAYANAAVFVLPAVYDAKGDVEGLGVVLIEALSAGVPVVASDAGGIPDVVRHERTGLLVPPGDAGALAAALRRVLTDRDLASRLVETGRRHVQAEFSWPAVIDKLQAAYALALERREA